MNDLTGAVLQSMGVLLVAAALSSVFSSLLYTRFRRLLKAFGPHTRSMATLCYAMIAPAVAVLTMLLYTAPIGAHWLVFEHCHGAECGTHAPLFAPGSAGSIGLLALSSVVLFGLTTGILRVLTAGRRQLATLFKLGEPQRNYVIIDSGHLVAWCCGLLRPRIVLSRALVEKLDRAQLEVILAHEQAHISRYDNLRNVAARWATGLWLPNQRRQIRHDLAADNEAACDAIAQRLAPETFQQVVDLMTTHPRTAACPAGIGSASSARLAAATDADIRHPFQAHLLVAGVWTFQILWVAAAAHPLIEVIAAAGI